MKILELFSGTESFSKICKERRHEAFTIDINKKFNPTLVKDILLLKKEDIPFIPNIIWSSPPCEQYSHAKRNGKPRDIESSNKNVLKTLEIISWFPNCIWFIENPQTSLLKNQIFMKDLPFFDVSYCKYGLPYRKQTRIWTNLKFEGKVCNKDCNFMNGKKHIASVGNGRKFYTNKNYSREEKYIIPKQLCKEICIICEQKFGVDKK